MINQNSAIAFDKLNFRDGMTQMEKVRATLEICGPLSDRELSEKTGIPRHLLPARRGQLVKLGSVRRLKSTYDKVTKTTVEVWATTEQVDELESKKASEAVRQVLRNAEQEVTRIVAGGLFALAFISIFGAHVDAANIQRKVTVRSPFVYVSTTPSPAPKKEAKRQINTNSTTSDKQEIKNLICEHFGDNCATATAIFTAESGLRANAQGWNCWYDKNTNEVSASGNWQTHYSKACSIEHRQFAWSVDCGVAQMNVSGKNCPTEYLDPRWNIAKAYEWKFKPSGWNPWVVYKTGAYLSFLNK